MKIFVKISRALLVGCFLAFISSEALAQAVNLKVEPMSPGRLTAIGKSSNAATTGLKVFGKGGKSLHVSGHDRLRSYSDNFVYMVFCFQANGLQCSS